MQCTSDPKKLGHVGHEIYTSNCGYWLSTIKSNQRNERLYNLVKSFLSVYRKFKQKASVEFAKYEVTTIKDGKKSKNICAFFNNINRCIFLTEVRSRKLKKIQSEGGCIFGKGKPFEVTVSCFQKQTKKLPHPINVTELSEDSGFTFDRMDKANIERFKKNELNDVGPVLIIWELYQSFAKKPLKMTYDNCLYDKLKGPKNKDYNAYVFYSRKQEPVMVICLKTKDKKNKLLKRGQEVTFNEGKACQITMVCGGTRPTKRGEDPISHSTEPSSSEEKPPELDSQPASQEEPLEPPPLSALTEENKPKEEGDSKIPWKWVAGFLFVVGGIGLSLYIAKKKNWLPSLGTFSKN